MCASKTGSDQGDPFAVNQSDERHGTRLSCFCADGGELNDIPAKNFSDRVFPLYRLDGSRAQKTPSQDAT